ncbi:MerR family regulatory protein [Ruegeria sp. THAF57]|uniref:MerR family transcriptional regulator n=1 Tax=Ruegeria sp. THAF57 TaxID=2744555 RepID=UPI0015E05928|nr:MerR family transcriptional regulator [Ruegeria sp. THAF57]CAD0185373.1 MerR family regulatory protein [Ruegeria sp. THAF57]
MSKSPDAFRTISEVADWLGVQAHVLRFWESRFSQVKPVKRAGGRRYYRPNDMRLLGGIKKLLHEDGITIKGVQRILREQGIAHVASLSQSLDETAQPDPIADNNVVVPFATKPAPAQEQITLDLEAAKPPEPAQPEPAPVVETPQNDAPQHSEPEYLDEAPLMGGIATQAWNRTDFDDSLLRQIAPVAKELRAVLDRIENRSAG